MIAGFPLTTAKSGTFFLTTEFAPTIAFLPTVTPGNITALIPIQQPSLNRTAPLK